LTLGAHTAAYTTRIGAGPESVKSTLVHFTITGAITNLAAPTSINAPSTTNPKPAIFGVVDADVDTSKIKLYVDGVFTPSTLQTLFTPNFTATPSTFISFALTPAANISLGAHEFLYTTSNTSNIETGRSPALTITITA
jgi:hypothetical protein